MPVHLAHRAGELKAVHLRHHDVGDDQVEQIVIHLVVGVLGVQTALGLKPAVVEIGADDLVQLGVVLHHKDMDHFRCLLSLS